MLWQKSTLKFLFASIKVIYLVIKFLVATLFTVPYVAILSKRALPESKPPNNLPIFRTLLLSMSTNANRKWFSVEISQ
jgi:hypothetical protein